MSKKTIWAIVTLTGLYIGFQAVADVAATKLALIMGVALPAGSIIFAATFTLRDLIHKRMGRTWARACIIVSGGFNVIQAFYLLWMARLPYPEYYQNGEAWSAIFALVPAITVGSIIAEILSELADTEVYQFAWDRWPNAPQWSRVVISNAVSLPLDSFLFATFAFVILPPVFGAESLPFITALGLVAGQITWKAIVTVVSMPTIYLVKEEQLDGLRGADT